MVIRPLYILIICVLTLLCVFIEFNELTYYVIVKPLLSFFYCFIKINTCFMHLLAVNYALINNYAFWSSTNSPIMSLLNIY